MTMLQKTLDFDNSSQKKPLPMDDVIDFDSPILHVMSMVEALQKDRNEVKIDSVIDFGGGKIFIYFPNEDRYVELNRNTCDWYDLSSTLVENLEPGSVIVTENAHLGCPRVTSKAQYFIESDLLNFYDDLEKNGLILRLFPEKQTTKAKHYANLKKTDKNDPKSIYVYLKDHPKVYGGLKKPLKDFHGTGKLKKEEGIRFQNAVSDQLNVARAYDYSTNWVKYAIMHLYNGTIPAIQWMYDNLDEIKSRLSQDALNAFQLDDDGEDKLVDVYTIISALMNPDGTPRLRNCGDVAGWKFVKQWIICAKPNKSKSGTASSNIYYHRIKAFIARILNNKIKQTVRDKETGEPKINKDGSVKMTSVYKKLLDYIGTIDDTEEDPENPKRKKLRNLYSNVYLKELYVVIKDMMQRDWDSHGNHG